MFRFNSSKLFIIALIIMILATSAYAFAANLTITGTANAGEGSTTINGYTVSGVTYTYSTDDPSVISFVDFTISPAATKAGVAFNGGTLTDCGTLTSGGTHAHCPVSQGVFGATSLRIVASD